MNFKGKKVAIIPCTALGDVTIYLRLAWIFRHSGAQVRFLCSTLFPAREYFDWLHIEPSEGLNLESVADSSDLAICYINWLTASKEKMPAILARDNIAYVTAKKLPRDLALDGRPVKVLGEVFEGASRPLCLESRAGMTMVQWIDHYAREVFGLTCELPVPVSLPTFENAHRRVAIFPTTPHEKKNYAPSGFRLLGRSLIRRGWQVEFVCMPSEQGEIAAQYRAFPVHSFPDVKALMAFLAGCSVVISNDSGGGHLGSLMGLRTFTITRKNEQFVWRPGFNARNSVLAPLTSFKLMGRYVWRPFIPVWRIPIALGRAARIPTEKKN